VEEDTKYYSTWSNYIGAHIAIFDASLSSTRDDIFTYLSNVFSFVKEILYHLTVES
jgi:hypothetical protein